MTDIDFDEIDRAIASATGKQEEVSVPEIPADKEVVRPTARIVQRSRPTGGRVMDIVHPASTPRKPVSINPTVTTPTAQSSSAAPELSTIDDANSDNLPESPFITGAKIDKRPLGGLSVPEDNPSKPEDKTSDYTEDYISTDDAPDNSSEMFNAPLPAELHSDIMNIETAEIEIPEEPIVEATPLSELASQDTNKDSETVSIYDTDTYHKPLAHPQKKQSGLLTTLWIALIILLGAGIGAAFYFFILPLL